ARLPRGVARAQGTGRAVRGLTARAPKRRLPSGVTRGAGAKPVAPAVPRATFAAHPSLRVGWAEVRGVFGVGISFDAEGKARRTTLSPVSSDRGQATRFPWSRRP